MRLLACKVNALCSVKDGGNKETETELEIEGGNLKESSRHENVRRHFRREINGVSKDAKGLIHKEGFIGIALWLSL